MCNIDLHTGTSTIGPGVHAGYIRFPPFAWLDWFGK